MQTNVSVVAWQIKPVLERAPSLTCLCASLSSTSSVRRFYALYNLSESVFIRQAEKELLWIWLKFILSAWHNLELNSCEMN